MNKYFFGCFLIAFSLFFSITLYSKDSTIIFSADKMFGSTADKNETTTLSGNAQVTIGNLHIHADEIELSGDDFRYVKAYGNVQGEDKEQKFSFNADILEHDRKTDISLFQGSAQFNDTENEVEAGAEIITYNKGNETVLLQTQVFLKKNKISCTANDALYRRDSSLLDLTGNPIVVKENDEFKATRIQINLDSEYITLEGKVSGKVVDEQKDTKNSD